MVRVAINLAPGSLTRAQLRRLQTLWHRWMRPLKLDRERDQQLRHAYVEILTRGRARTTTELSRMDAAYVIRRLERVAGRRRYRSRTLAYVAGTAGREGYEAHPEILAMPADFRLLDYHAAQLGMSRVQLDHFIAAHYGRLGLHRRSDIRRLADLNRVLWGLKALLRRRAERRPKAA